jgi:DMSO/TMAO reductase YedYZ molybdopterin-dependent catalytic subunit
MRKSLPGKSALSRRQMFVLAAAGVSALRAADPEKRDMIVRSVRPEDLEMPVSGFADNITPIEHFFVRTHVNVPAVDAAAFRLKVEGTVAQPLALTLDELKQMPAAEIVAVAECAGNGRNFYEPYIPGAQWQYGAVGNGRWKGVRLADVLKRADIKGSAVEVVFDGADIPIGTMPDFQRAIPIKRALDANTILAYEMNGQTLPVKHGFPLRVIVPGWASDSWTKWLTSIRVMDKPFDGFWMTGSYRKPANPVAPGAAIAMEQMEPVTSLKMKSLISSPLEGVQVEAGKPTVIRGVAWTGDIGLGVTTVEVSVDGGRSWRQARLEGPPTLFGFRSWSINWTPARESFFNLMARATDKSGATQPFAQEWNPSGYGWNVVHRVGVSAVKTIDSAPRPAIPAIVNPAPSAQFKATCNACHEEDVIGQQRLTRAQWGREIDKMVRWGAQVKPDDRETFLDYLTSHYGPRPR